jgi:hypothetical protein
MFFQLSTSFHYSTAKQMLYVPKIRAVGQKMSLDLILPFLARLGRLTSVPAGQLFTATSAAARRSAPASSKLLLAVNS